MAKPTGRRAVVAAVDLKVLQPPPGPCLHQEGGNCSGKRHRLVLLERGTILDWQFAFAEQCASGYQTSGSVRQMLANPARSGRKQR
jgi:hypothetical protein